MMALVKQKEIVEELRKFPLELPINPI